MRFRHDIFGVSARKNSRKNSPFRAKNGHVGILSVSAGYIFKVARKIEIFCVFWTSARKYSKKSFLGPKISGFQTARQNNAISGVSVCPALLISLSKKPQSYNLYLRASYEIRLTASKFPTPPEVHYSSLHKPAINHFKSCHCELDSFFQTHKNRFNTDNL